jgi:predicted esterase
MKVTITVILFSLNILYGQRKVESRDFKTQFAGADFIFPEKYKNFKALFYNALNTSSEKSIITLAIALGGKQIGLQTKDTEQLARIIPPIYEEIEEDEEFKNTKSALPYCLSSNKTQGHYFIYTPEKKAKGTILFLHGYGGNFLFYMFALKKEFPDYKIIIPTYGVKWAKNGIPYLNDLLKDLKIDNSKEKIWLMALSGGGPIGFEFYKKRFDRFKGYTCLASTPLDTQVAQIHKLSNILIINGKKDSPRLLQRVAKNVKAIKASNKKVKSHLIDGSHFFMMTNRKETFNLIRKFIEQ